MRNLNIATALTVCLVLSGCVETDKSGNAVVNKLDDFIQDGCKFKASFDSLKDVADIFGLVMPYGDKIKKAADIICKKYESGAKSGTIVLRVKNSAGVPQTVVIEPRR